MAKKSTTFKSEIKKTLDDFVGRKAEQETIQSIYSELDKRISDQDTENDYFLLNFYGIGGKGKSKFLSKAINNIEKSHRTDKNSSAIEFVEVSFEKRTKYKSYEPIDILELFRTKLTEKTSFNFKQFDNKLADLRKSQYKKEDRPESENSPSSLTERLLIITGKTALNSVPFGNALADIGELMWEKTRKNSSNKKKKESERLARAYRQNDTSFILRDLKEAFVDCYNNGVRKLDKPFLFFIDVFEDYNFSKEWLFTDEETIKYGYGLFHSLENTLWVVSGRDRIKELNVKNDWTEKKYLSIELINLDQDETKEFLNKNEIRDNDIAVAIYEKTDGFPLWLAIYKDFLVENKSDLFLLEDEDLHKKGIDAVIERYVQYFRNDENSEGNRNFIKLVQLTVSLGSWTDDLFKKLIEHKKNWFESKYPVDDKMLVRLKEKSFVKHKELEDGKVLYSIDKTIEDILFNGEKFHEHLIDMSIKKDALYILMEKSKVEELRSDEIQQIIKLTKFIYSNKVDHEILSDYNENIQHVVKTYEEQMKYREVFLLKFDVFNSLHPTFFSTLEGIQEIRTLLESLANYTTFDLEETLNNFIDKIELTSEVQTALGYYFYEAGKMEQAIGYFEQVLKFKESMTKEVPGGYIFLSECYFVVSEEDEYQFEIDILSQGDKKVFHIADSKEEFEIIIMSIFGIVNCYFIQNKYGHATDMIDFLNVYVQKDNEYQLEKMIHLYYSLLYCYGNNSLQVRHHLEWLLVELDKNENRSDPFYLRTLSTCCAQLMKHDHRGLANEVYEKVKPLISEILNKEDLSSSHIDKDIGEYLFKIGEYTSSNVLLEKAVEIQSRLFGDSPHPDLLQSRTSHARSLIQVGELKKAEEILEKTLSDSLKIFDKNHLLISEIYEALGDLESYRLQYKEAEKQYNKSFLIKSRVFGLVSKLTNEVRFKLLNTKFYLAKETSNRKESSQLYEEFIELLNIMMNTDNNYDHNILTVKNRITELETVKAEEAIPYLLQELTAYAEYLENMEDDFKISGLFTMFKLGYEYGHQVPIRKREIGEIGNDPTPQEMREITQVSEKTAKNNTKKLFNSDYTEIMLNRIRQYCNANNFVDLDKLIGIFEIGAYEGMTDAVEIILSIAPSSRDLVSEESIRQEVMKIKRDKKVFFQAFSVVVEELS